jgi:hypothetical protein
MAIAQQHVNVTNQMHTSEATRTVALSRCDEQNLKTILTRLQKDNKDPLPIMYRCGVVVPPMDTDQLMREAYWKHYSDENIKQFGLCALAEFNRTNDNGTADEIQFKHLFPEMFDDAKPLEYEWTRDDVRKFVEGVPNSILTGLGY